MDNLSSPVPCYSKIFIISHTYTHIYAHNCVCVCVCKHREVIAHTWWLKDNLQKLVLSYHVGPRVQTKVVSLFTHWAILTSCLAKLSFSYLSFSSTSRTTLSKNEESIHIYLSPDFGRNALISPTISVLSAIGLSYTAFIMLRYVPSIPNPPFSSSWRYIWLVKGLSS